MHQRKILKDNLKNHNRVFKLLTKLILNIEIRKLKTTTIIKLKKVNSALLYFKDKRNNIKLTL
jgi:hypothetical protein